MESVGRYIYICKLENSFGSFSNFNKYNVVDAGCYNKHRGFESSEF